jgi:ATP-dependent DNA ligase
MASGEGAANENCSWSPHPVIMDGEAVSCGPDGIASFDRIRRHDADVFMWAFDLIELNGDDVRRDPLAVRKATLERSAETISFSVRSDCSLMRARICRECFSNGEVLPPRAVSPGQWR